MYTEFYHLQEKPFSLAASSRYFYLSEQHKAALTYLKYGLMDRAGIILMTGDVGAGKTTLVKHLVDRLSSMHTMDVVLVDNTSVIDLDLMSLIIDELGVQTEPGTGSRSPALHALHKYLKARNARGKRVLLVVDEAQTLSDALLEEIRMLSNMQHDQTLLLQILLVGQPELRDRLNSGYMRQLTQRMSVATHLGALTEEECGQYIAYRLQTAGRDDPDLFTPDSVRLLHKASGGVPRLLNVLCNAALMYGFADEQESIGPDIIKEVLRDRKESGLPISPAPAMEPAPITQGGVEERMGNLERTVKKLSLSMHKFIKTLPE